MPEHNILTGSALHEPKDVSTAPAGSVYVADGAASGTWKLAAGVSFASAKWTGNGVAEASMAADAIIPISGGALAIHHQEGGYTLNGANDGIVVPTAGDYEIYATLSGVADAAGTDKFVVTFDIAVDGVVESVEARHYYDKTKDQQVTVLSNLVAIAAGAAITVTASIQTGDDAGGAFPYTNFTISNYYLKISLLHETA